MGVDEARAQPQSHVLVVVADDDLREAVTSVLHELSMMVCAHTTSLRGAMEHLATQRPTAVLVDASLNADVRSFVRGTLDMGVGVVLLSTGLTASQADLVDDVELLRAPFDVDELLDAMERARRGPPVSGGRRR